MGTAPERNRDHAAHANVLLRLAQTIGSRRMPLHEALGRITEAGTACLGVDRCSVWAYDGEHQAITCLDLHIAAADEHQRGQVLQADEHPAYFAALSEERVLAADDARGDPRTREFRTSYLEPLDIHSMIDAPIWVEGEMVGILCHEQTERPRDWRPRDEAFAGSLADLAALALESHRHHLAEQETRRLERQLERSQRLESVGRLAGGVAHDFNNMLTVVTHGCEELLEGLPGDSPLRAAAQRIAQAAERSSSLTRQLLAFSSRQPLDPRPLDLNVVVTDVDHMLRPLIGEDIDLQLRPAATDLPVLGDTGRLSQVLVNLVVNARDAMPDGGRLTVSTHRLRGVGGGADQACLSVEDTGTGIAAEHIERLFDPFFTTKPEGEGTGLGLASVFGICRQLGGRVEVRSAPGEGARFDVLLPLFTDGAPADASDPGDADVRRATGARPLTILLVEDEQLIRDMVAEWLARQEHRVLVAPDPERALALAEQADDVDLLISDVIMPGLTGVQLRERLLPALPGLLTVFMSGYPAGSLPSPLPPDVVFLPKPFRLTELDACMAGLVGG